jgi:hypothetical protein
MCCDRCERKLFCWPDFWSGRDILITDSDGATRRHILCTKCAEGLYDFLDGKG